MKIYIIMKTYWMYQPDIDKVFANQNQAKHYIKILNKKPNIHAYIIERELEK